MQLSLCGRLFFIYTYRNKDMENVLINFEKNRHISI